jgi:DNA-binding MarR family transcriptional regulator
MKNIVDDAKEAATGELGEAVLVAVRRLIRAVDLHSKRLLQSHGLSGPQLLMLRELAASGGGTVGGLAERVRLSQATVTEILGRLQRRGLVDRSRSPVDRRCVQNRLTTAGRQALRQAPPLLQEAFTERLARLQPWEQNQLLASVQRLASLMDAEGLDVTPLLGSAAATEVPEAVAAALDDSTAVVRLAAVRGPRGGATH